MHCLERQLEFLNILADLGCKRYHRDVVECRASNGLLANQDWVLESPAKQNACRATHCLVVFLDERAPATTNALDRVFVAKVTVFSVRDVTDDQLGEQIGT